MTDVYDDTPVRVTEVLDDLEKQLGDLQACESFAMNFITLWEPRHAQLLRTYQSGMQDQMIHAVAGLHASSAMLGLAQLSALCEALRERISEGEREAIQQLLPRIRASGQSSVDNLQQTYLKQPEAAKTVRSRRSTGSERRESGRTAVRQPTGSRSTRH